MQNIKMNITLGIAIVGLFSSAFLLLDKYTSGKRIAYVRSSELVYGYLGMKDAHSKYEIQTGAWQANIDTLKAEYQNDLNAFTSELERLSNPEKTSREKILKEKQQSLIGYAQSIDKKAQEEDKKMTDGVLNQINSFVSDYGKDKGYDIILGTTESGSLMYGNDGIDITKEVLESLNRSYKGEPAK
jgi:outer membrane protein